MDGLLEGGYKGWNETYHDVLRMAGGLEAQVNPGMETFSPIQCTVLELNVHDS